MSNKPTHKDGTHPSRIAHFIDGVALSDADWRILEGAVGKLNDAERAELEEACEVARDMAHDNAPTLPALRATLAAMAKLTDGNAIYAAYRNCDSTTKAMIDGARYRMDGPGYPMLALRPAKIRAAAWLAGQDLPKSSGGRRADYAWRRHLAEWAITFCEARGIKPTASDDHCSVAFLHHLIRTAAGTVAGRPGDQSVTRKLLAKVLASSCQTRAG